MLNGTKKQAAMNVQDVATCLKISRAKAYELVQSNAGPAHNPKRLSGDSQVAAELRYKAKGSRCR